MFKIEEHALYSKRDLKDALKDVCHVESFLRRVRPRRVMKQVYYGLDIINALERLSGATGEDELDFDAPTPARRCRVNRSAKVRIDEILKKKT
jgi:hypothetical protein